MLKDDAQSKWTTGQKDANVRDVVQRIWDVATAHGCRSVTIENLNFSRYRTRGREAKKFAKRSRKTVMGMPTAVFRERLVAMGCNRDDPMYVIAVDPAYTSMLGRSHWLPVLRESYSKDCTAHQAAAVVIGRRGQGFLARRSVNVHEAEQKSRKRCFDRSGSIRGCAADPTANPSAPREPVGALEVGRRSADPSERATRLSGGNKPLTPPNLPTRSPPIGANKHQ